MTRAAATLLLLVATLFWGVTFAVVKEAVAQVGVFVFLAQRFTASFAVLAVFAALGRRRADGGTLGRGLLLGGVLFAVYVLQTLGLSFTSATNAAFLTGLGVVLVPLLAALLLREPVRPAFWGAIALSAAGLFLLTTGGRWGAAVNRGDLLALGCAVGVAAHLLLTDRFAPRSDIRWLAATQVGVVALGSLLVAAARGERFAAWHPSLLGPLAFCALLATAYAFPAQAAAQRVLTPTHAAVIVTLEPVFAAAWAAAVAGERLGGAGFAGGALVLAGMLLAELGAARCGRACHRRPG